MTPHVIISLDLDDTVYDTFPCLHHITYRDFGYRPPSGEYLTPGNTDGILTKVLEEARFMTEARLRKGFSQLGDWVRAVEDKYDGFVKFQFVTHRGYHSKAHFLTMSALELDGLHHIPLYCIDPEIHTDKVEWVMSQQPGKHYLVDDRPKFDKGTDTPVFNVYIMDQPWNRGPEYALYQNRVKDFTDMRSILTEVIRHEYECYQVSTGKLEERGTVRG